MHLNLTSFSAFFNKRREIEVATAPGYLEWGSKIGLGKSQPLKMQLKLIEVFTKGDAVIRAFSFAH